ncbi:probable galactinol--sucrose galactosyltransferase 6 [Dendrobium catenatum]|uniref:galactinol--sucrose galactosyltransferase n=1 Tax=Dendrobium catenatum TaxID=906689 RepID=A0A2I0X2S9_9ASPA|nr:probable galactinol--sucrose galactosyltransferase 6 [Dendrobium catenatum]PKU82219.1 putative galactinol--sucrose galactosyltransferase 6 [Dendrobium catenatum]
MRTAIAFCSPSTSSLLPPAIYPLTCLLPLPPKPPISSQPFSKKRLVIRGYFNSEKAEEDPMVISSSARVSERNLVVRGRTILSSVPGNVILSSVVSSGPVQGFFLGAQVSDLSSRHVVSLGILREARFMACFRFKLWWMAQKMGNRGAEIPFETQFLLVESKPENQDTETLYSVFLPILEGSFRASLQGNSNDCLDVCIESGDADIRSAAFSHVVFVGTAASDPFAAITGAVRAVKSHLQTFRLREEKQIPAIVDFFGWCTWDAFYQDVTQSGVEAGLQSLISGGAPPKFVIIDDGWQSVESDTASPKQNSLPRLIGIKENGKFQSMKSMVSTAKEKYGLKFVYVWHAITGYWGGVQPGSEEMAEFESTIQYPNISPGVAENEPWMKTDILTLQGLGLINPKSVHKFYNELHSYLATVGIDGVKVDVQSILETLGTGHGGRVQLARQYHDALDASVAKNFPDNGCIACMCHHTDALYCAKQTAVVRASDDFYPRDSMSHTIHIASVAFNNVFLGEFMVPDWDMFHSLHPAGEYHASARAISGGPVYVSDAPGKHNFELLRKLVLPDGSILRAQLPGRPTVDCLFTDPARDGVSLLKIWNMNKFTGVLGVFNCQGAAWCSTAKKNIFHSTNSAAALTSDIRVSDVHLISEAATETNWNGDCAVYRLSKGELIILPWNAVMPITLNVLEHEIFTISPIRVLAPGFRFAPLGLLDMFNTGGAIDGLKYEVAKLLELDSSFICQPNEAPTLQAESRNYDIGRVCMEVKGCGRMGAYSSAEPKRCLIGAETINFAYDASTGLVTLQLQSMPVGDKNVHSVVVEF